MLGVPKNGTTTHVVVPSQHKHKIKHDKTTMQSPCLYRGGISTIHVYSHTHKQLQVDLHQLNKSHARFVSILFIFSYFYNK